jgi:hypothetical protein
VTWERPCPGFPTASASDSVPFSHDGSVDDRSTLSVDHPPTLTSATDTLRVLRRGVPMQRTAGSLRQSDPAHRQPSPVGAGRPSARRRRVRRGHLAWRIFVCVVGAILLVICSGMALGIVTVGGSDGSLNAPQVDQPVPSAVAVTGLDGVYPGGAARAVPVTVRNRADVPFEITAVRPDLSWLRSGCPASAWRIAVAGGLPTVAAGAQATVSLPVALAASAPNGCQSVRISVPVIIEGRRLAGAASATPAPTLSAPGSAAGPSAAATITSAAVITTATLGSPRVGLQAQGSQVVLQVTRAASGPAPDGYEVDVLSPAGAPSPLCALTTGRCQDSAPAAADRTYLATAHLAEHWVRQAAPLQTWTAPPVPHLAFVDDGQPSASALLLDAAGAENVYDVSLYLDGAGEPFQTQRVPAGAGVSVIVEPPGYGAGDQRIVAVAVFHGRRAYDTLTVPASTGVQPTANWTVVPTPSDPSASTPVEVPPSLATNTTSTVATASSTPVPPPSETAPGGPATAQRRAGAISGP